MPSIGSWCVIINDYMFLIIHVVKNALLKSDISGLFKAYSSQFSTYRHRTGFIVKRKQVRMLEYLSEPLIGTLFFYKFLNLFIWLKNILISKNFIKFIIKFFIHKDIFQHTYIFIKCFDNFKFSISLKSYEE